MTEEQSKRDWEPKEGDTVAIIGGGWERTVTMAEVLRLTKTQIVVKATGYVGASEARFRRAKPWTMGRDQYPRYREVGGSTGRWDLSRWVTSPDSADVAESLAREARRDRVSATLAELDLYRRDRNIETAQKAVEALQEFIRHEQDTSGG